MRIMLRSTPTAALSDHLSRVGRHLLLCTCARFTLSVIAEAEGPPSPPRPCRPHVLSMRTPYLAGAHSQ